MLTPQNSFACTEIINSNGLLFFSILIFSYTIQVSDSYREVSSSFSFLQNNSIRYFLSPTKAPYCYDAFVLLGRWSKGTLFNYLLYFFFLLTIVVPMAAPPLMNNRAIHSARLLVSPVWGSLESSFSFAVTVSAFSNASCSAYFVAGVLGIPLVHYVEERGEVVILWFVAVHAVIDCDKAYLLLGEQNLGIKADLKIVSAETAHILDDNRTDFPGFGFCKHCLKSGTVEVTPCVTVIFQKIVCKKFIILKIHINCNLCYSIEK